MSRFYEPLIKPLEIRFLAKQRAEASSLLPKNSRVLEIGAGTGLNFRFQHHTNEHIATDISCPMLNIAASKPTATKLAACDAERLPFPDNTFDAALGTLVFCSIPDTERAFTEIQRVLRPNSRFVMFEHVRPPGVLGNVFDVLSIATVALTKDYFNRETTNLARRSGLSVDQVKPSGLGVFEIIDCRVEK